jgi:hypothetical protein
VPRTLSRRFKERGTRFLIHPQARDLRGFAKPEVVYVDAPPGSIGPGPADQLMYVVDAVRKDPYLVRHGRPRGSPPYQGPRRDPVAPGRAGHFDHTQPGTREFSATMVFASVRCALEVWESYFGRQIPWQFRRDYSRLEVIPRVEDTTAWSGYGFLEFGRRGGLLCENFDVVAHELGHSLIRSVIGRPPHRTIAFRAFDEASADLIAITASLHFESVVAHLMAHTKGNLFSSNILSRIGELNRRQHVRNALNAWTMQDAYEEFVDENSRQYQLSLPFTGGAFEVLVEIYEQGLLQRGVVTEALVATSRAARRRDLARTQREFGRAFGPHRQAFITALFDARDYFGRLLARTWEKTSLGDLRGHTRLAYERVVGHMLAADAELSGGRYQAIVRAIFERRGILSPARR